MGVNGPNPFNNITLLDAATLDQIAQWEVERAGGDASITAAAFDSQTGNLVFGGHANQDLADAEKPGGPGVFKSFYGFVNTTAHPEGAVSLEFLDDGTPSDTEVFVQAAAIRPFLVDKENPRADIFVAGTRVPIAGPVIGYVDRFVTNFNPFTINDYRNLKERTDANYTDLKIGGNLNLYAWGHEFIGPIESKLILDPLTFDGTPQDSLTLEGDNGFAQRSVFMTDGTGWTGFAGAAGGFPTSPGAPQPNNAGDFDGFFVKTEDLNLNPLAIVTAGGFKGAPFVPYGMYTAFFDWSRIPGLIQPALVDGKFPKEAGGMVVKMNGEPTAITAVSNRQVNFIAHNDVDQNPTATLQLCYTDPVTGKTFESNIATMPAQSSWVNLFEIDGAVAAFHSNGIMTRNNRQHRDDFLAVVGTGGGGFGNPSIEADEIAPLDRTFAFDNLPEVKAVVGEREFEVQVAFGGLLPGLTVGGAQYNLFFPDAFWLFACAQTNVEYTLTVTDTETGEIRTYDNALGQASPAIQDTSAFATCP